MCSVSRANVKHNCSSDLHTVCAQRAFSVRVCVFVCYRALVRAVYICLRGEDRQVSVENDVCQGVDHWLIVDDQKNL